jgi:WXG100 family type VII secretion target
MTTPGVNYGFTVSADGLIKASQYCQEKSDLIQAQIGHMRSLVGDMMLTYQGPAALAFHDLSERWHTDSMNLKMVLETISQGLAYNANNYATTEQTNTANYTRVDSRQLPTGTF